MAYVRLWSGRALAVAIIAMPSGAIADTVSISPSTDPALGRVVAGTSTSKFTIGSSNGAVSLVTGDARRLSTTSTISTPTVTFTCISCNGNLASRTMTVTISSTATGRVTVTNFTRSNETKSDTGISSSGPTSGFPLVFSIVFPSGAGNKNVSYKLGMDVQLSTNGSTGALSIPYTVTASRP